MIREALPLIPLSFARLWMQTFDPVDPIAYMNLLPNFTIYNGPLYKQGSSSIVVPFRHFHNLHGFTFGVQVSIVRYSDRNGKELITVVCICSGQYLQRMRIRSSPWTSDPTRSTLHLAATRDCIAPSPDVQLRRTAGDFLLLIYNFAVMLRCIYSVPERITLM
jgi:hypothetical protein